ncbi:DNA cytosine methyltransferase [Massilia genomosp. 1]|uniref:DNA (cytosine-5-)-methyltransferase n=1 Tax=Massilia genomosp. 1 TaxID=2609280 RepID=A0ABX0N400_9BURK|nr:DNA (cytosine-5-)-methyltransferase [Massilia genomosp. 1]NHZ66259.1 DNA (cytosine-5-)-methyltransferase [Massilia genomosp. 1]
MKQSTCQSSDDVLALFAGAGGLSYGFSLAGLKPVAGAEIDSDACSTYRNNLGSACFELNLGTADPDFFTKILSGKEPLAVIGGPPCQGFSTAGARNAVDPRNALIFNYLEIVKTVNPRWFVFENVEGLLTSGRGEAVAALVERFLLFGYSVRLQKVNFAAYGVPQTRKRVVIIGNRLGIDFEFPEEVYSFDSGKSKKRSAKPFAPSINQALAGLGHAARDRSMLVGYSTSTPASQYDALMRGKNESTAVSLHWHSTDDEDVERFSMLAPGQSMKHLPEELWHPSFRRRAFRRVSDGTPTENRGGAPSGIKRLHADLNCLTITGAATREFIHPTEHRALTLRECARLQSFPDSYEFSGPVNAVSQQIGNAVPPQAALSIAQHLMKLDARFGSDLGVSDRIKSPRLLGFNLTDSLGMSEALRETEGRLVRLLQPTLF